MKPHKASSVPYRFVPESVVPLCAPCASAIFGAFSLSPLNQFGVNPLDRESKTKGVRPLFVPPPFAVLVFDPGEVGLLEAHRICAHCLSKPDLMIGVRLEVVQSRLMDLEAQARSAGVPLADSEDASH